MKLESDWIDYLEGEGTESERGAMKMWLRHSPLDQEILGNLCALRAQVKLDDPGQRPLKSDRLEGIHDRIMTQIELRHMLEEIATTASSLTSPKNPIG